MGLLADHEQLLISVIHTPTSWLWHSTRCGSLLLFADHLEASARRMLPSSSWQETSALLSPQASGFSFYVGYGSDCGASFIHSTNGLDLGNAMSLCQSNPNCTHFTYAVEGRHATFCSGREGNTDHGDIVVTEQNMLFDHISADKSGCEVGEVRDRFGVIVGTEWGVRSLQEQHVIVSCITLFICHAWGAHVHTDSLYLCGQVPLG